MDLTNTQTPLTPEPLPRILERIAMPLMLFSAVLFSFLFLSWFLLLPRFAGLEVDGSLLAPQEIETYAKNLKAELATIEQKRDTLILPTLDPAYDVLKEEKRASVGILTLRSSLLDVAARIPDSANAVIISSLSMNADGSVTVTGDVQNVGPRSMTVLAAFIDSAEHLSSVAHLERPAFTREQSADGSFHSPFTMRLTLQSH